MKAKIIHQNTLDTEILGNMKAMELVLIIYDRDRMLTCINLGRSWYTSEYIGTVPERYKDEVRKLLRAIGYEGLFLTVEDKEKVYSAIM